MKKKFKKFKFIDLFAGIGGFHHALSSIGGECVMTCELDQECQKTYISTFPKAGIKFPLITNIREITRNEVTNENSLKSKKA
jgi:DNA (cytosine-5)-methyltransferase 1